MYSVNMTRNGVDKDRVESRSCRPKTTWANPEKLDLATGDALNQTKWKRVIQ
jgi:hypothetical protein